MTGLMDADPPPLPVHRKVLLCLVIITGAVGAGFAAAGLFVGVAIALVIILMAGLATLIIRRGKAAGR